MKKFKIVVYETTRRTQEVLADNEKAIVEGDYSILEDTEDCIEETEVEVGSIELLEEFEEGVDING